MSFKAFADDTSQSTIDELTLENQGDRVSIYGSVQISCDQIGLDHARQLLIVLQDAVQYLEQQEDLPAKLSPPDEGEEVDNPFWQNP